MKTKQPTQSRLKEVLGYEPATGLFHWKAGRKSGLRAGGPIGNGYRAICFDGAQYYEHRLAWLYVTGSWPNDDIDHENMVKSDNRFSNLRKATRTQNFFNLTIRKHNKSGFKGVSRSGNRFFARITVKGKKTHLGCFATPEDAHAAYLDAAKSLHGAFFRSDPNRPY